MTVRTRLTRSPTRPRLVRRAQRTAPAAPEAPTPSPFSRERAAGGPEDRASYRCTCGYVFEAPVSASVGCPHCGSTQAW